MKALDEFSLTPSAFWAECFPYAQECHEGTGVLVSVLMAQAADETAYGGYDWTVAHNPGNVGSFDGQSVNKFASLSLGTLAWIQTFNNGLYNAVKSAVGWGAQCTALGYSPWASARYIGGPPFGYPGGVLIEIIQDNNLTRFDTQQPQPPVNMEEGNMWVCTDPTTGSQWGTDANGDMFAFPGAPFVAGLNQHPEYKAGSAESGGTNPCIGLVPWKASDGLWGVCYITRPTNGQGNLGTPYSLFRFRRDGTPD